MGLYTASSTLVLIRCALALKKFIDCDVFKIFIASDHWRNGVTAFILSRLVVDTASTAYTSEITTLLRNRESLCKSTSIANLRLFSGGE